MRRSSANTSRNERTSLWRWLSTGDQRKSVSTVERNVSRPDGVASNTARIPTPKIVAASRKSRLNTSSTAANANARPIRYIATLRPVSPARLAACSSESLPPDDVGPADTAAVGMTLADAAGEPTSGASVSATQASDDTANVTDRERRRKRMPGPPTCHGEPGREVDCRARQESDAMTAR